MMSFTPILNKELEQGKLMAALNTCKGPKKACCVVHNRLKISKISRKTYCVQKFKKNGYWEFDHRVTLKVNSLVPPLMFLISVLYA